MVGGWGWGDMMGRNPFLSPVKRLRWLPGDERDLVEALLPCCAPVVFDLETVSPSSSFRDG